MDQLKNKVKNNKMMVRRAAPVTVASTGFVKLSRAMDSVCLKIREKCGCSKR